MASLKISDDLHRLLKIRAAENGTTVQHEAEQAIAAGLGSASHFEPSNEVTPELRSPDPLITEHTVAAILRTSTPDPSPMSDDPEPGTAYTIYRLVCAGHGSFEATDESGDLILTDGSGEHIGWKVARQAMGKHMQWQLIGPGEQMFNMTGKETSETIGGE